jgi:pimeloyl-ACP methyl ester carboxylesterase
VNQIFPIAHAEATTARIPGAELWTVEGMGHAMPSELWDEMASRVARLSAR